MLFNNQRSDYSFINIFHNLMKGGQDDGVAMNPWTSQEQVVWRVCIDYVTRHFWPQVPDLASELDRSYRPRTIGIEVINDYLGQPVSGYSQMLHHSAGHNAQRRSRINMNVVQFRWSDISCVIHGSIMFLFDLHIIGYECCAGEMLGSLETVSVIFLLTSSWNLGYESLEW